MRSINKVFIIGNLTRDPVIRSTQSNQQVCTFGLATNRQWVTRSGEQKKSTEFHECVAWAKMAEICSKYLKKSKLIFIEGYLKTRSFETPDGVKRFRTEIVVKDMIILEKRPKEETHEPNGAAVIEGEEPEISDEEMNRLVEEDAPLA